MYVAFIPMTYDIYYHLLWLILWYTLSLSLKGVPKHSHDDANTILVFEVGQLTLSLRLQSWSWTKARCRGVWMESMVGTSRGWFTLYNPTWCKCAAWTTPSETAPKPQPSNRNSHQRMFRSKYNKIYVCACMYVLTIYTYIHTYIPYHYITLHYISLHYIHYITLHSLHYITLYYIVLHYITYHIISYHIYIHIKSYQVISYIPYRTVPYHTNGVILCFLTRRSFCSAWLRPRRLLSCSLGVKSIYLYYTMFYHTIRYYTILHDTIRYSTLHYTIYIYTLYSILYTMYSILYTLHSILNTIYFVLCCTLYTL